jgi:peptidoglycan-associated lipoprotein
MSSIVRPLNLVAVLALLVALGCASNTTPVSKKAASDRSTRVTQKNDPGAVTIQPASSVTLKPIYFDTDRALLKPEARDALKSYAKSILDHPEWGVLTIEGHCDERGSEEYNLALGERRATVVQSYLTDMGVPRSRLATRSFGEEKPAVARHEESAWRYNRRSELQVDASANR